MPSEAEIEERMPVWDAFSTFFLDTELGAEDHERIARQLAATRFSTAELEAILVHEVRPVCGANLRPIAGTWQGFDREWMKQNLIPRLGRRPWLHLGFKDRWMYRHHWDAVRPRIADLRSKP